MRKFILVVFSLLFSLTVFCQTVAGSFQCRIRTAQALSPADISRFIIKQNMENYRLLNKRTILSFDNGFDIVLLSATEAQTKGLINNTSTYQVDFSPKFKMPVFHMTPDGRVSAAYPIIQSKYSSENH